MKNIRFSVSPAAPVCWAGAAMIMPPAQLVCFAAAIAIHEAGHLLAIKATGGRVTAVRIRPAGLEIERGGRASSYAADAAVSIAGPAASVATAAAGFALGGVFRLYGTLSAILGVFNALPIEGLDGGYALKALLLARLTPEKASAVSRAVSMAFTLALWVASVWVMLMTGGNASLFIISCALFFAQAFRS